MSTIPKEIMDKIKEASFEEIPFKEFYQSNIARGFAESNRNLFVIGAEHGYQLATDGREELEKENEAKTTYIKKLEKLIDNDIIFLNEKTEQIRQLQSQCTEKEKEISGYKKVIELKNDEITEYSRNLRNAVDQNGKNLHGAYLELQAKEVELEELKAENERLKLKLRAIL